VRASRDWSGLRARQSFPDSSGVSVVDLAPYVMPVISVGYDESDGGALNMLGATAPSGAGVASAVLLRPVDADVWVEWVRTSSTGATDVVWRVVPSIAIGSAAGSLRPGNSAAVGTGFDVLSGAGLWALPLGLVEPGPILLRAASPAAGVERPEMLVVQTATLSRDLTAVFGFREAR